MGTYCLDWWERLIVHLFVLTVLGLVVYGLYKQVTLLLSLYPWADLTKTCGTDSVDVNSQLHPT